MIKFMKAGPLFFCFLFSSLCAIKNIYAAEITAYELLYNEKEQGTDVYKVRFVVSDDYIRIDEPGDDSVNSGYIIYDHKKREIYSVSSFNKSTLVIPYHKFLSPNFGSKVNINYKELSDAPKISDKTVYTYVVKAGSDKCMDIQLVAGFLPKITKMLRAYQMTVAGQQVKALKTTPDEYRTTCFLYDQVYNDGKYYEKGLPIQEWHSNGKERILISYKKIKVDSKTFDLPDGYREYSID